MKQSKLLDQIARIVAAGQTDRSGGGRVVACMIKYGDKLDGLTQNEIAEAIGWHSTAEISAGLKARTLLDMGIV